MNIIIYENNKNDDCDGIINSWDEFVQSHPAGSIFQTSTYYNLFTANDRFHPIAILMVDERKRIRGVLSGIIQYHFPSPFKWFTSRCVVIGGPIVDQNDTGLLKIILQSFEKLINKRAIYSQFRNISDVNDVKKIYTDLKFNYEDHLNILIDLTKPEDTLWKEVDPQKRQQYRRAMREGLNFKLITNRSDFDKSYELLCKLYSTIKLPIFPISVFDNAFTKLTKNGMAVFFGAYLHEELVGTMYALCYNGRICDYFAGSNSAYYNKYPNSFIPWQVMLWGKNNGMTLFDWGGAGKPGVPYGVRDYKAKFGGQLVNYGRFEKIHNPFVFQFSKMAFRAWQFLKKDERLIMKQQDEKKL